MTTDPFSFQQNFLIVDDEALIRMELAEVVRDCGFEAWEASNTAEALAVLQTGSKTFAGLITDINMPGTRSGLVLANHVRWVWPRIKIIVMSAVRVPRSGELPAHVEFVAKPVQTRKLVTAIQAPVSH